MPGSPVSTRKPWARMSAGERAGIIAVGVIAGALGVTVLWIVLGLLLRAGAWVWGGLL